MATTFAFEASNILSNAIKINIIIKSEELKYLDKSIFLNAGASLYMVD